MLVASRLNMINGEYAFIHVFLDMMFINVYKQQPFKWWFGLREAIDKSEYLAAQKAYSAVFILAVRSPTSERYEKFKRELKKRSSEPPFFSKVYEGYLMDGHKFPANKTKVRC